MYVLCVKTECGGVCFIKGFCPTSEWWMIILGSSLGKPHRKPLGGMILCVLILKNC